MVASTQGTKVGLVDARELMPKGRIVYEAVRNHLANRPKSFSVLKMSPAAEVLIRVAREHSAMEPPLPEEVVRTIGDFTKQYHEHVYGPGYGDISSERDRLEDVADQLISVVFEYGYASLPTSS